MKPSRNPARRMERPKGKLGVAVDARQNENIAGLYAKREAFKQSFLRERTPVYGEEEIDQRKAELADRFNLTDEAGVFGLALFMSCNHYIQQMSLHDNASRDKFGSTKAVRQLAANCKSLLVKLKEPGVQNRVAFGRSSITGNPAQSAVADEEELRLADTDPLLFRAYFETVAGMTHALNAFIPVLEHSDFDANSSRFKPYYFKYAVAAPLAAFWRHFEHRTPNLSRGGDGRHGPQVRFLHESLLLLDVHIPGDALQSLDKNSEFEAKIERFRTHLPEVRDRWKNSPKLTSRT